MSLVQQIEWCAWGTICVRLREMGIDVENEKSLITAIKTWGEALANLRRVHGYYASLPDVNSLAQLVNGKWQMPIPA